MFSTSLSGETILARALALIIAVTVHEFAHAIVAYRLGDPTAARLGRITLNPAAHFDPFGFMGLMMLAIGWPAVGWGKPVPVNTNLVHGHKKGLALVAAAGPMSNLLMALALLIPLRLGVDLVPGFAGTMVRSFIIMNLLLAAFNMIPIPPLDGSKLLSGILPNFWYPYFAKLEQYAFPVLIVVILMNYQFSSGGRDLIGTMYAPVFDLFRDIFVGNLRL